MGVFRNQFTKLMQKDMYKWFFESYDRQPTVYDKIFRVEQSDSAYERSTTGIGMGALDETPEGNDVQEGNPLEGFTVIGKNRSFRKSVSLTEEFSEDTPPEKIANFLKQLTGTWGEGVIISKETFAAKFFNRGGLTAGDDVFNNTITGVVDDPNGGLCYDGKPFFNLSGNLRSSKGGGTYYNGIASALSDTTLQTAYNLMTVTNNRNERDDLVQIMPNVLLIPGALRFTAKKVLESEWILGSANNDVNVVQNLVKPIEWQYLTDTDAWFLGTAGMGLVWQERKEPVIDFYQNDVNNKYVAKISARWGARMDNWRYWVGSNFSTS